MHLTVILNAILCGVVIVTVVAPLVWAILTQHRDKPAVEFTIGTVPRASADATRRTERPHYEPVPWPAR